MPLSPTEEDVGSVNAGLCCAWSQTPVSSVEPRELGYSPVKEELLEKVEGLL